MLRPEPIQASRIVLGQRFGCVPYVESLPKAGDNEGYEALIAGCAEGHVDEDGVTYVDGRDALAEVARVSTVPGANSDTHRIPSLSCADMVNSKGPMR